MFTVTDTTPNYTSPLIGNGEITTTLGPTGYHNGVCPLQEAVNRTIFWAGRRLNTPTHALVRFGQLQRSLKIDGVETTDEHWQQRIDYDHGSVVSRLDHGGIVEETRSLVCLTANILVFHTKLNNQSHQPVRVEFALDCALNRTVDARLDFPLVSHADVRPGDVPGNVEADSTQLKTLVDVANENSLRIRYQINEQLGELRLGWSGSARVEKTNDGGCVTHVDELLPGLSVERWTWLMLSDREHYTHFPDLDRVRALLDDHARGWASFWTTSTVELEDETLNALRQASLYTIRCNASPWSIPPAYLATHWEGHTFHDELYPFLGLMSSGHDGLAARIPEFRVGTLPVALARSGYQGASFPWETLENGQEGGPYGHWMDERFHTGQFAVTAWQFYLYTQDAATLSRMYPLLRGCAERFVFDVLVRDQNGRLGTRLITDFDEAIYPLTNGIFTICAAVRSLEIAARAAEILDIEPNRCGQWRQLALELRQALPVHAQECYYKVSDDGDHWHIAQVGMVYPFSIDIHSAVARETLTRLTAALRTSESTTSGSTPGYNETHWLWTTALLATAFFYQGRATEGYALLKSAPNCVGPFSAPNEQKITRGGAIHYRLPWFTTSAGAFVYALNAMLVYVNEAGTILFNGLPEPLPSLRFAHLSGTQGVTISGQIDAGQVTSLRINTKTAFAWIALLPTHVVEKAIFVSSCSVSDADQYGLHSLFADLDAGENELIQLV